MRQTANREKENIRKIRERIRRYERAMEREQAIGGMISDGYGKRYLLGPLYLLAGDLEGCLRSFDWFQRLFPDDAGEPMQSLCWSLALYRSGARGEARKRLAWTMLKNLYLIPALWGEEVAMLDIWHDNNWSEPEYLSCISKEMLELWKPEEVEWARGEYESGPFQELRGRYVELSRQLNDESVGKKRNKLCEEIWDLERNGLC